MADEQFILTQAGHRRLLAELETLKQRQADQRGLIGDWNADDPNSLNEQEVAAFFEVKTTLEHISERLGHIQFVLDRAEVRQEDPDPQRIDPGERVVVWDFESKSEITFDILSGEEVQSSYTIDDGGRDVSISSPVGQALVGRGVGDIVEVEVPDGVARYAVRRIEAMPGEV